MSEGFVIREGVGADKEGLEAVYDRAALLERVESDAGLLATLLQIFRDDAPGVLGLMEEAALAGEAIRMADAAHTLKGSALLFGSIRAGALSQELEDQGRAGSTEGAMERVQELRDAVRELQEAVQGEVERLGGPS